MAEQLRRDARRDQSARIHEPRHLLCCRERNPDGFDARSSLARGRQVSIARRRSTHERVTARHRRRRATRRQSARDRRRAAPRLRVRFTNDQRTASGGPTEPGMGPRARSRGAETTRRLLLRDAEARRPRFRARAVRHDRRPWPTVLHSPGEAGVAGACPWALVWASAAPRPSCPPLFRPGLVDLTVHGPLVPSATLTRPRIGFSDLRATSCALMLGR
jgi:hypothetical protein